MVKKSTEKKYINFNFAYIKGLAAPGSWRRGYEYYQKKQILEHKREDNIVEAYVKGNFQDKYTIKLNLSEEKVGADCDCPLEEEWCKHAVCVGLESIRQHYYDNYVTDQTGETFEYEEENPPEITNYEGNYKVTVDFDIRPKFVGIKIFDRKKNEVVKDIESILRAVIALQKSSDGQFDFNPAQKTELTLMQNMYKFARLDKKTNFYTIQSHKLDTFIGLLAQLEEVIDAKTNKRLIFKDGKEPWHLILAVNVSLVGNVLLSLHWKRPDNQELLPLEELKYFSKQMKWAQYKNIIVPLDTMLSKLPHYLTRSTFTDIRDADGGKFVYEELPRLKKLMQVEVAEYLEKLALEESHPINVVTLETDEDAENTLKATLEFEYDGTIVPYGKLAEKTPYVTVKNPDEEIIYWVKRNVKQEETAYKILINSKFLPRQTNNLHIVGDDAIDFYNDVLFQLGDEFWRFEETEDVPGNFEVASSKLKIGAKIDFDKSIDSFNIQFTFKVGRKKVEPETVQNLFQQGQKYFYLENAGYVEIPPLKILQLNKSLTAFDAELRGENNYNVKTFRAGIVSDLLEQKIDIKMSEKFKEFWDKISSFNTFEDVQLPEGVDANFREYQKKGFNWLWFLYSYGLNGILADDMGLGKTLQTLTLIQKAKEEHGDQPCLVVCPTSVVFNWESEIQKFTKDLTSLNLTGSTRKDFFNKIDKYDIVITSYALLRRDIDVLKNYNFRLIILDESQNIKNQESLTAQSAKQLACAHRFALSGTPIENRLSELWSVFDFLMPGFLYDLNEFDYRYITPIETRGDTSVGDRLKKQVYPFILRRLKRDCAKDLPDKLESVAYCQMTSDQRDLYLDVLDSTRAEIFEKIGKDGFEKSKISIFSALMKLRQICNHPQLYDKNGHAKNIDSGKFEHFKEMLEEIVSEGHRVLIFSQFVQMLDIVKDWLEEKRIKYEYLTGSTTDRAERVQRFNSDNSIPIFLLSLKAGGTGLNLTGADYVIHYDPWWNPAVEDQATDRAHRIGQTKKVFVYRFITKGTVEEKIMRLKERKRGLVDSIISVDRTIEKSITFDDIKDILSPNF